MSERYISAAGNQRSGIQFHPWAALVLTAAATLGAHAAIERGDGGHGPRIDVVPVHHLDHIETGETEAIGPKKPEVMSRIVMVEGEPVEDEQETLFFASAPYARQFDKDSAAEIVDQSAAQTIRETIDRFRGEGLEDIRLTVIGKASAEDEDDGPDAGLTTASDSNLRLAGKRVNSFETYLRDSGLISQDIPIMLEREEGVLNEETHMPILREQAAQFGYESPASMIKAWNAGKPVPPEVQETLDAWLTPDRGVTVVVMASRFIPGEGRIITKNERVCILPVREVEKRYETTTPWKATLPWPIIPIPAVSWRRRQKSTDGVLAPDYRDRYLAEARQRMRDAAALAAAAHPSSTVPDVGGTYGGGDVSGSGGGAIVQGTSPRPVQPEGVAPAPTTEQNPEPTEPQQGDAKVAPPPKSPEPDAAEKERHRRRWLLWLVPIVPIIGGIGLAIGLNGDRDPRSTQPLPAPHVDPCANLPVVERIDESQKKTVVIVNGQVKRVQVPPR